MSRILIHIIHLQYVHIYVCTYAVYIYANCNCIRLQFSHIFRLEVMTKDSSRNEPIDKD